MARCRAAILALAALLAAAAAPSVVLAQGTFEAMQDTTFSQLAPMAGQWNISVEATRSPDRAFVPQVCPDDVYAAPCNQPPLNADAKDKLRVTATLKAEPLRTVGDLEPKRIWVKACYARSSLVDRPWRKGNDNIDKDKSCPFIVRATDFNASTYTFEWNVPKNMTKAMWYAQVLVQCTNGTQLSFCQTDNTRNTTFFATSSINSTPTSMIIATAVCSAVGPLFLAGYFLKDMLARGKAK